MSAAVTPPREDGKTGLKVISNTEIATFRRCVREWFYTYVLLRRPRKTDDALRFGTLWHVGQEAWWGTTGLPHATEAPGLSDVAAARFEAGVIAMREHATEDTDPFELVKAEELLLGYTARWGEESYETIGVEVPFTMPLVNPETNAASRTFQIGGKIDVVARHDGRMRGVEHKTTSSDIMPGSDYWRLVSATDPQVSTYMAGARSLGYDVDDFLYDVVRKVALRPKKATPPEARKYTAKGFLHATQRETDETPEEFRERVRADIAEKPEKYFARGPIVRLENDEAEHAGDVWMTAAMMREAKNAKRFPRSPNACSRFNRMCPFFDVCSGLASIDDDNRFRTATTPHEELQEV